MKGSWRRSEHGFYDIGSWKLLAIPTRRRTEIDSDVPMRLNFLDRSHRRTAHVFRGGAVLLGSAVLAIALGCESKTSLDDIKVAKYEQRMV